MRTALIAAIATTDCGTLRAELRFGGRSVLAWQVDLLRALGVERFLCLCHSAQGEVLRLQHALEAEGAAFHALRGFAALPALVRAEDELIILRDGVLPDAVQVQALVGDGPRLRPLVACLPDGHPLSLAHPADFERIDSSRHWAGLLVMRGAAVQQLADFPADADAISLLLRLSLQAGTPCAELDAETAAPEAWMLADSAAALAAQEQALIKRSDASLDWRAPLVALASLLVRRLAERGILGGTRIAAGIALGLMVGAIVVAVLGYPPAALALATAGAFAGNVSARFAALARQLLRRPAIAMPAMPISWAIDAMAAGTLVAALVPQEQWSAPLVPLAVCGLLVIGLARLAARAESSAAATIWSDRASLLAVLALAAALGLLAEATALFALTALGALLLRRSPD